MTKDISEGKDKIKVLTHPKVVDFLQKEFSGNWLVRFFKDNWWKVFNDFWYKFGRAWSWFFFMWNNNEWDPSYIYLVLRKKLQEQERHMHRNKVHTSWCRTTKLLRICVWYLDRLINVDACENLNKLHTKRYGNITMDAGQADGEGLYSIQWGFDKCDTPEKYEWAHKVNMRIHQMEENRYAKYRKKLFYILEKYIEWMWD